jgi:hypothetical protein
MGSIRSAALIISIILIPIFLCRSLVAPLLLLIGVIWLAIFILVLLKRKEPDYAGLVVTIVSLGALLGIYFIPLWVAERKARTPAEYLKLAEKFMSRGQLMGNQTKAQAYYLKAAEGGNVIAQARIGEAFYFGHFGVTNREKGIEWLKVAAANGHVPSQQLLQSLPN